MADYGEVYRLSLGGFQSAIAEEQAAFQKATIAGDVDEQVRASQSLASLRATAREYHQMATEHAASLKPAAPANKYFLSAEEQAVAHASRSDLNHDQAEAEYARQKARYQHMRATGQYRDDQGTVRR